MGAKKTEDGFLTRWSRRKLEGTAEPEPDAEEGVDTSSTEDETAPSAAAPEGERTEDAAPEFTEEDVEKLGPGADYSVFLKKGVAAHVQRLALRKLWLSNPVLANLDGLVDYGDDYRANALAQAGKVASSWKVGKGHLRDEGDGDESEKAAVDEASEEVAEAAPAGKADDGEEAVAGSAPDDGDDDEKA